MSDGLGEVPDGAPDPDEVRPLAERDDEIPVKMQAMDEAPIGITIADVSVPNEPLIYVNEGFEHLTDYPADRILGRNCRFLQGEETDEAPVNRMREAIENRDPVSVELRNYRRDGTEFWNRVTLAPLQQTAGEVTYYVGFQQDISARKQYEERLKDQSDSLETLNAILRHDIRNDLQLLLSNLELLESHVDDEGQELLTQGLETVQQSIQLTQTARNVTEVVLEGDTEREPVSVELLLSHSIEEAKSNHPAASIELDGSIPQERVLANDLLSSVFDNIITNAIQHNDADEPHLRIDARIEDEVLRVRIADNGPGIPEAQQAELFQKGVKGEASTGTGLGLYLVKTLIGNYRGDIWVEDSDLGGAAFVVELPLA